MNITALTQADVGRWVAYTPPGQPHTTDIGRIKGWNQIYIWVVFTGRKPHWDTLFAERTSMACLPSTLRFIAERTDGGFDEIENDPLEEAALREEDEFARQLESQAQEQDRERNQ